MGSLEQANHAIAGLHGRVIGQGVGKFRLQLQLLSWADARAAAAASTSVPTVRKRGRQDASWPGDHSAQGEAEIEDEW